MWPKPPKGQIFSLVLNFEKMSREMKRSPGYLRRYITIILSRYLGLRISLKLMTHYLDPKISQMLMHS